MRVFIRLEDLRVITIWCPDNSTIQDVKRYIISSNRSHINISDMRLISCDCEMLDHQKLVQYTWPNDRNRVHACLKTQQKHLMSLHHFIMCIPSQGSLLKTLPEFIQVKYFSGLNYCKSLDFDNFDVNDFEEYQKSYDSMPLHLRSDREEIILGRTVINDIEKSIQFYPKMDLIHGRTYTVHINGLLFQIDDKKIDDKKIDDNISERSVISNIVENQSCRDFEWSFTISPLQEIRLVCYSCDVRDLSDLSDENDVRDVSDVNTSSCLVIIPRKSPSLYMELIETISARLNINSKSIVQVFTNNNIDLYKKTINTSRDVAILTEVDYLYVLYNSSQTCNSMKTLEVDSSLSSDVTSLHEVALQRQKYNEENWVNDASGCLAVCGKMTEEEENDLLLQVVEAFHLVEDNTDGIGVYDPSLPVIPTQAEYVSQELPLTIADRQQSTLMNSGSEQMSQIDVLADAIVPSSERLLLWPLSSQLQEFQSFKVMNVSEIQRDLEILSASRLDQRQVDTNNLFVSQLKTHGYAIIDMDTFFFDDKSIVTCCDIVENASISVNSFFNEELSWKQQFKDSRCHYLGYSNNTLFNKELFQMRIRHMIEDEYDIWSRDDSLALKQNMQNAFRCLNQLSALLTSYILLSLGFNRQYIDSLLEKIHLHSLTDSSTDQLFQDSSSYVSMSNITAFRYNVPQEDIQTSVHCPHHSDISLLTIIPRAYSHEKGSKLLKLLDNLTTSGLHVYDWLMSKWMNIELNSQRNYAVVFVGECMARLTNNCLLPCMHEVAVVGPGPRISIPFQFCPTSEAFLDPSQSKLLSSSSEKVDHDNIGIRLENHPPSIRVADFIQQVSISRISSNFPR